VSDEPLAANGGPVFPDTDGYGNPVHGMKLRDWFAGQAMTAILIAVLSPSETVIAAVTHQSYAIADAMLAEREKANK